MSLKEEIRKYSKTIGIDDIGFLKIEENNKKEVLDKIILSKRLSYLSEFSKGSLEEKTNPLLFMEDAKTLIVVLVSYYNKSKLKSKKKGYISTSSWGIDYHLILKEKEKQLIDFLKEKYPDKKFLASVDTTPLDERYFGYLTGLGFYGKNNLLISPRFGTFIFLGTILTDLEIKTDKPLNQTCLNCNACIKVCPTKALNKHGVLNSNICLSYITQKKGIIEDKYKDKIKNVIYGCDICQNVCPHNQKREKFEHPEFLPNEFTFPDLIEFISISNEEYKKRYGKSAMYWRKRNILKRNALIAIGNIESKEKIKKAIEIVKNEKDEGIQDVIRWLKLKVKE